MKKFAIVSATMLALAWMLAAPASAQKSPPKAKSPAPRGVVDYLRILPVRYSKLLAANPNVDRVSLIKIDNRKTNFLRLEAENFAGYAELALFPKKSGGFLVAVNENQTNAPEGEDGAGMFFEYEKGKWRPVDPLPRFTFNDLMLAFERIAKREATDEEKANEIFELHQPKPNEITLKIGGVAVYGFVWNGEDFDGGDLAPVAESENN